MKIEQVSLKEKLFIGFLVLGCVALILVFSVGSIFDLGESIVVMSASEYQQSLK